jgi:hypothetical protein
VTVALAAAGLQATASSRPFRPPEGPLLAAAPRTVLEVPLPKDPDPALIVVYAFTRAQDASVAARDQAAYVSSNTGRAYSAPGTRFVLQVVDATVVWFTWLPGSAPDPGSATIAQTLAGIGATVDVPA